MSSVQLKVIVLEVKASAYSPKLLVCSREELFDLLYLFLLKAAQDVLVIVAAGLQKAV